MGSAVALSALHRLVEDAGRYDDHRSEGTAAPKGLRHGFGIVAVEAKISLNLIRRGLGQAQLSTRCIDLEAVGAEEQCLAARRQE